MDCERNVFYAKRGIGCKRDAREVEVKRLSGETRRMTLCSDHRKAYGVTEG